MLKQRIIDAAKRLGFDLAGCARVEPEPEAEAALRRWIDRGYHAGMKWMEADPKRRSDPAAYVPGTRTILSLALNYQTPYTHLQAEGTGKISRYAWGEDYHRIVSGKLGNLLLLIMEIARSEGIESPAGRMAVDTAPVMEKHWAQRAGVGWIGKNSCLLTNQFGSWVFLGEILLNFDLESDPPETDQCGRCTLCVEACPTGALDEPYVVDANLCISYRTIEHRGEMPEDWGSELEGWLFGCDICQDVCPYNNGSSGPAEGPFRPRNGRTGADLEEIGEMDAEGFTVHFGGTPVTRAKLAGLQRNAKHLMTANDHK